jgi:hypothetical protein
LSGGMKQRVAWMLLRQIKKKTLKSLFY